MIRSRKSDKVTLNEEINAKEKKEFKNGATKKVVKISEETPIIVNEIVRKPRPKSADIRPRSKSLPRRPMSAQISNRPISQQIRVRGHRPNSAQVIREENSERRDLIASFNRSLRLLGLHVEELTTNRSPRRPPRVEGPSFHTRLYSRTVSLENVRACALEGQRLRDRRAVADAVYQEWYFTKLQQERERRERENEKREFAEEQREKRKAELQAKAEENFLLWKCQKDREAADLRDKQKQRDVEMQKLRADAAKIQKVLADWNNNKTVQLQKAAKEKKEKETKEAEKKRKDEQEKQQHAREAYASWQKKTTELQKNKAEKEQKLREADERKRHKMLERKIEAQECFISWKSNKDKQFRNKIRQIRSMNADTARQRSQKLAERMYEAEQAYQDWLDSVEVRSNHSRSASVSPSPLRHWN